MDAEPTLRTVSVEQLLHNASDGVFVIDRERRYVLVNKSLERMTGYDSRDLVDRDCVCSEVLDCRDEQGRPLSSVLCPTRTLFEGAGGSIRQRCQLRRRDGSRLWIETIYAPVNGANGKVDFVFGLVRDITEAKCREEELLGEVASLRQRLTKTGARDETPTAARGNETVSASTGQADPLPLTARHAEFVRSGDRACARNLTGQRRTGEAMDESKLRLDPLLAQCEREAILRALDATHGQRNKAAQLMGISRSRLYRRMEALGVDLKAFP